MSEREYAEPAEFRYLGVYISPAQDNVALKPESTLFQPKQSAIAYSSFHCELGAA